MPVDVDLEALRKQWQSDRPKYEALCARVTSILRTATQARAVDCEITSRTKETDSLLKKALRKDYADPYHDIRDKGGVRVICTYRDSLAALAEIVKDSFEVSDEEDKAAGLEYDALGYPGIHFEVRLRSTRDGESEEILELPCEIQLLTRAQSLWADISHELAYKPTQTPPFEVKRAIYLQSALVEIFDNQMTEARKVMLSLPGGQEMRMLDELDKHFYQFTSAKYDRELSLMILDGLRPMFSNEEIDAFGPVLESFVERRKDDLQHLFEEYASDDRRSPLLFQPESIVILMCLERDVFRLKDTWGQFMPLDLLQGLADAWGVGDIGRVT